LERLRAMRWALLMLCLLVPQSITGTATSIDTDKQTEPHDDST
jgi:hypothetical protein